MRNIIFEELDERLVLRTPELDSYIYLRLEGKRADTSLLDDNTCQKAFACSAKELRKEINERGY